MRYPIAIIAAAISTENGTYTTSGSTLTTRGRTTENYEYCATGNTLNLIQSGLTNTSLDGLTATSEIKLARQ